MLNIHINQNNVKDFDAIQFKVFVCFCLNNAVNALYIALHVSVSAPWTETIWENH